MVRTKRRSGPHEKVRELISGHWVSQCLFVAAKLGVADALAKGPRTAESVAQQVGGQERTREEFVELFARAGLRLARVVPTGCPLSILEAVRA